MNCGLVGGVVAVVVVVGGGSVPASVYNEFKRLDYRCKSVDKRVAGVIRRQITIAENGMREI
jgi:hypothetical protein